MEDPFKVDVAVNVKEDAKTPQLFVRKLSEGIAGVWRPIGTVANAVADTGSAIIKAAGGAAVRKIEGPGIPVVTSIEQGAAESRALTRLLLRETRAQQNLESIVGQSVEAARLLPPPSADPVDPDWLNRFFDDAKDVSDQEMQKLLSKILAGEVVQPGRFSRRTLSIVREMSVRDLQQFQAVCSLAFENHEDVFLPTINEYIGELKEFGIRFDDIFELDFLGLVHSSTLSFDISAGCRYGVLGFMGHAWEVDHPGAGHATGFALTPSGKELARVLPVTPPNEGFCEAVLRFWTRQGFAPASPLDRAGGGAASG